MLEKKLKSKVLGLIKKIKVSIKSSKKISLGSYFRLFDCNFQEVYDEYIEKITNGIKMPQ